MNKTLIGIAILLLPACTGPVRKPLPSPTPTPTVAVAAPMPAASAPQALLHWGLVQEASDALRACHVIASQVTQVIGGAVASAGTHLADGTWNGKPYGAAVDLSVKHPVVLNDAGKRALLNCLGEQGFAAYYRNPGYDGWPASDLMHVHAVWPNVKMKYSLRNQIHDWLHGKNGLASHTAYHFWQPTQAMTDKVRAYFLANNPANG